ncbi:MAG: type I secretion C-terminal target domain-containing protein, partial [Alphaproteobacteria bacterium]
DSDNAYTHNAEVYQIKDTTAHPIDDVMTLLHGTTETINVLSNDDLNGEGIGVFEVLAPNGVSWLEAGDITSGTAMVYGNFKVKFYEDGRMEVDASGAADGDSIGLTYRIKDNDGGTSEASITLKAGSDSSVLHESHIDLSHITEIASFTLDNGADGTLDVLDFSKITGFGTATTQSLHFTYDGTHTSMSIDNEAGGNFATPDEVVVFENMDLTSGGTHSDADIIALLQSNGQIIV